MASANNLFILLICKYVHNIIYVNKEKCRAQHTPLRYHISIFGQLAINLDGLSSI